MGLPADFEAFKESLQTGHPPAAWPEPLRALWYDGIGDWEAAQASFDPTKRRISINVWVLDDFDAEALPIEHVDGRNQW